MEYFFNISFHCNFLVFRHHIKKSFNSWSNIFYSTVYIEGFAVRILSIENIKSREVYKKKKHKKDDTSESPLEHL